jgi:hypothetical protein
MEKLKKTFIFLITLSSLLSCETKEYQNEKEINSSAQDLNESNFSSELKFSGITSIYNVTDSTVSLEWTDIEGAVEYHIFDSTSGTPSFHSKILAPASNLLISNLQSGQDYSFIVRVKDSIKLLDSNTISASTTTLAAPNAPTLVVRVSPVKVNGVSRTPEIAVLGVNRGDTVELYSDACITKVGEGVATSSSIVIKSNELTPDLTYSFYSRRINENDLISACSSSSASYTLDTCPDGYIEVPANDDLSIQSFCVMKHEARPWVDLDSDDIIDSVEIHSIGCNEVECTTKNWGTTTYSPGSTSSGPPWRMIDSSTAKLECQSLGENYDLISNIEWMTIAENVEAQDGNWSGGTVATGCLFRGNTGVSDACGYSNSGIDYGAIRSGKSILELSNTDEIYDFSGNVAEWVDWEQENIFSRAPVYCTDSWGEITDEFCDGSFKDTDFRPFNPKAIPESTYLNSYGLGLIEGGSGGNIVRGGGYLYGSKAGVYSASLAQSDTTALEQIGFRCVYRIPHP